MHASHVPSQQLWAVEGFGAQLADMHLCLGVSQLMLAHVRASDKMLAAVLALCSLHLGVRGLMGLQVGFLHKVPSANVTAKPLDS